MSKYDSLKILRKTRARVNHVCMRCGEQIAIGDFYYAEALEDKFLHSLHRNKFCKNCYEKIAK